MRVLVISAAFPPMRAAEGDHIYHLCQHLADRGMDVQVLTTHGNTTAGTFQVHPIMQHWGWSELPRLLKFLKRCSPDAILLMFIDWIYNDQPMITFVPTISKALFPHVPFVTKLPNPVGVPPRQSSIITRIFRKAALRWAGKNNVDYRFGTLLRDSDRLIVFSNRHRAHISGLNPTADKKSVLVPPPPFMRMCPDDNEASRHEAREALGVTPNDFLLAYFGYIYPNKGVETLLAAFELVNRHRTNVRLVLVGGIIGLEFPDRPSYAQELQAMPKRLGIEDKVRWTGECPWDSDEASRYLRAADACVLPFDTGVQLNNSSVSAVAAHGLPIVTTHGEILEEPFIHRENVFLCSPKSPEAMAQAITTVIDNRSLRERLHAGALELSREWFSWDSAVNRTIQTLAAVSDTATSLVPLLLLLL